MWRGIRLEQSERMIRFPYPVRSVGCTQMEKSEEPVFSCPVDHVEFCVRMKSKEPFAIDQINGVDYQTPFPHLVVKMPFAMHRYEVNEPRDAMDFSYSLEVLEQLRPTGLLPEEPLCEIVLTPNLNLMLRQLKDLMAHSQEYSIVDQIDLLCFHILEEVLFIRKMSGSEESLMEKKIRRIASFFQLHFKDPVDLDEIAADNGMSRCTFFRHWKRYFDVTPAQYLMRLKLHASADLLKYSDRKVADIAYDLHFHNSAYFCEMFKRHFGVTPLRYKREYGRENR